MSERPDIDTIRQRANGAMPGPWVWRGNVENHTIRLSTHNQRPGSGEHTVMDFVRWGMKGAVPRFQNSRGFMDKASDDPRPVYEVCLGCIDRHDERVYRGDFTALRHPDAEFIAHARQDIDDLLAYIDSLERLP